MKTLPELIVDNFDAEQVWAGVDLQNKAKFQKLVNKIENLSQYTENLKALQHISHNANGVTSKLSKRHNFNLLSGLLLVDENIQTNEIYDEEDDLQEIDIVKHSNKNPNHEQGKIIMVENWAQMRLLAKFSFLYVVFS